MPIYVELLKIENTHRNGKEALAAGTALLEEFIVSKKTSYDQLVLSL
jgi:hypothetical protein